MATKTETQKQDAKFNNLGIKVEGDIGAIQIVESSDCESSDDDNNIVEKSNSQAIAKLHSIQSIVQPPVIPDLSNVRVSNSENVQFGNNTYFHGPVTIKQIIKKRGIDNASYIPTDNENEPTTGPEKQKNEEKSVKKFKVPSWVKVTVSVASVTTIGIICGIFIQNHSQEEKPPPNRVPEMSVKDNTNEHSYSWASSLMPPFQCFEPKILQREEGFLFAMNYNLQNIINRVTRIDAKVVGICYHDFSTIIVFTILVPITISFIIYALLICQVSDGDTHTDQNGIKVKQDSMLTYPDGDFNASVEKPKPKADPLLIAPNHLRIVSRTDWLAQPVENELDKIRQPVPWVIITHTATEGCVTQSQCVLRVRLIQMFHIESKQWDDIGYNFLVAGDGSAYYGRGWDYIGAHTLGYNRYSMGIAFVGTFNNEAPPQKQIEACQKLIKLGVQLGKIQKDYKLFAHRQLASTLSPGDKLYDIIKEWPHFVKDNSKLEELTPKDY